MSVKILKQGVFDSIQDLGRNGFQHLGINPGGAMDHVAAQVANFLAGNDGKVSVIEIHFPAPLVLFEEDAMIALSGADFGATINDQEIPHNATMLIKKFSVLQFPRYKFGTRAYLAVNGGFEIPKWLDSYSTNLKAAAGGFKGRCLMKEDRLHFKSKKNYSSLLKNKDCIVFPWKADTSSFYTSSNRIRIMEGAEYDQLNFSSQELLTSSSFTITHQSDRMGYRMKGAPVQMKSHNELVTSAVTSGTIQLFPDGQFIILMADHQTTGGYPRIAHVISVDIPKLAQMRPETSVRFELISCSEAEEQLAQQQHNLRLLQNACVLNLENQLNSFL